MASNSLKLIFLCLLVSFFNFPTTKAQDDTSFIYHFCSLNKTAANSNYETNLRSLFSSLSSNTTAKTFYNNYTVGDRNSSDTVYGMFLCRGDVPSQLCTRCVANANNRLSSDPNCSLSVEAVIWYELCMVRYSNVAFFSTVNTDSHYDFWNLANISSKPAIFMNSLSIAMGQTAEEAANSGDRYSATTKKKTVSQNLTLYCLAQCTQDLSPESCTSCLTKAIRYLPDCCDGKIGGRVMYPSCNIRYELYPFYRVADQSPLVPETKYPHRDSDISHNCSTNQNMNDTAFQSDLNTLFSDLSSNATSGDKYWIQSGKLQGLYTCRGDLSPYLCGQCVRNATEKIASECRLATEGVIWYNHCWLRYSNRSFTMETSPSYVDLNVTDTDPVQSSDALTLISNKLAEMANDDQTRSVFIGSINQ